MGMKFNLQAALEASQWRGLRIDLSKAMLLRELHGDEQGPYWRADIYQNTETKSGREGKPKKIITIVSNGGESPADLLRSVAAIYEHGEATIDEVAS